MRLPLWCSGCGDDGAECYSGPPRWPDEVPAPFLMMERGFVDEDTTDESFRALKRRECASCAACEGSGHILSDAESEGAALLGCQVTKAGWCRRRGWPGDWTAARSGGTSCNTDKTGSTLDEVMRSRSSSSGTCNLIGGDTFAGRGAAVVSGIRDTIAASSVKRHS